MPRPDQQEYDKLKWLLKRLNDSEDYCRPYFERAKRHYRLYRFGTAVNQEDWPYVNRVKTRDILAFIEDSTALMVQTLFGQEPFFAIDARRCTEFDRQFGIDPMKIAKQMENVLQNQIADEDTEFFEETVDFFKGGGIYGNGYEGVYPRFDDQGVYQGPLIKAIDFWDVLPVAGARRVSKAKGLFVREFLSQEEAFNFANKVGLKDAESKLKGFFGDIERTWHKDLLAEIGITTYDTNSTDVETIHYFSGGHIITFMNRAVIVRDSNIAVINSLNQPQIIKPFPFDHPIVQYKYMPVPLEFFGMGIPEILEVLQEDKNLIRSGRRDNIDLVINKVIKARAGAEINYDLMKYYAGAIWPLENLNDIEVLDQGDVTQSSYMEEDRVAKDMENALSFFGYARGMTPTHEERPTTVMRLQQASLNRLDLIIKLTEFTVLRNIATRILLLTRRYMPQKTYEAILGEPDAGFYKMNEDQIRKYFLARPVGSSVTHVKETRQQQVQMAMQMLMQVAPIAQQSTEPFNINWYAAIKTGFDALDIKNTDQILMKMQPQQIQQQQVQQEQMKQKMLAEQLQQIAYGEDIKQGTEAKYDIIKSNNDAKNQIIIDNNKPQKVEAQRE
ncbi:MAG: hypothetical protein WC364_12335 [Eubacteriales bacterium]|jgi:hypothetical protein